jgi:hypothetical protein
MRCSGFIAEEGPLSNAKTTTRSAARTACALEADRPRMLERLHRVLRRQSYMHVELTGTSEVPRGARGLSANELRALFAGHTLDAHGGHRFPFYDRGPVHLYLAAGGVLYGTSHEGIDVGTWLITPDGQLCRTWHVCDGGRQRCYTVSRVGTDQFTLYPLGSWDRWDVTRRPGNPEGY